MILRFGWGVLCTFYQSCMNKFYLCFYLNSFSGDNVGSSQTTSSSDRLGRTRALWSCSEPIVGTIWNWRHHFKLRHDEKGWLRLCLHCLLYTGSNSGFILKEGSIRLCQHITGSAWILALTHPQSSPAQFTTRNLLLSFTLGPDLEVEMQGWWFVDWVSAHSSVLQPAPSLCGRRDITLQPVQGTGGKY